MFFLLFCLPKRKTVCYYLLIFKIHLKISPLVVQLLHKQKCLPINVIHLKGNSVLHPDPSNGLTANQVNKCLHCDKGQREDHIRIAESVDVLLFQGNPSRSLRYFSLNFSAVNSSTASTRVAAVC